jgi:hypothetical protein
MAEKAQEKVAMDEPDELKTYYIDANLAGIEGLRETHWYRKGDVDKHLAKLQKKLVHAEFLVPHLRIMATMACQHYPPCGIADGDYGDCCNSCWSRRFAVQALEKLGMGTGKDEVCPECGAVHLPGRNSLCRR